MYWHIFDQPQEYGAMLERQEALRDRVLAGELGEGIVLFLEHAPVYTLGIRGVEQHILMPAPERERRGIALYRTRRGGDVTYHGPGQLVIYPILDLRRSRFGSVKEFAVWWGKAIATVLVERYAVPARWDESRTGVWVGRNKIAAVGIHVRKGVAAHGFALNADPDLMNFAGIVPCGITDGGVTSIRRERGIAPRPTEIAKEFVALLVARYGADKLKEYPLS
jgi:lipoate-protein ligase B